MANLTELDSIFSEDIATAITGVPQGYDALVIAKLASAAFEQGKATVYVASDHQQMSGVKQALLFFAPWLETIELPAWDCLPYDRVSPGNDVVARRIDALARIAELGTPDKPLLVLTTVNALVQRVVPSEIITQQVWRLAPGHQVAMNDLTTWLASNGFVRTPTVGDRGEFSVRGGIIDFFAPGGADPVRLDFFGDTLESIRSFNLATQRTSGQLKSCSLAPMSEVTLSENAIRRFRTGYIAQFGAADKSDALYQAISEGRRFAGMEHWLPLYYEKLDTLFDCFSGFHLAMSQSVMESVRARTDVIKDHYEARINTAEAALEGGTPYKPLAADHLYLTAEQVRNGLSAALTTIISPFETIETGNTRVLSLEGKIGRGFAAERAAGTNVFDAVVSYIAEERSAKRKIMIGCWSEGSRDRLAQVLGEHGLGNIESIDGFGALETLGAGKTALGVVHLDHGFETPEYCVIAEQDILGDRLVRRSSRKKKGSDIIAEVASLGEGDIVVHVDHGIARFGGLKTIEAAGAPHDCILLEYANNDRLFIPVENIELLNR